MMTGKETRAEPAPQNTTEVLFYICIPVYKVEQYIDECIQSVLAQTYQNYCIILVDDGSPDRSGEICDRYAVENDKIHVIHQENLGQIAARNAAVQYARLQTAPIQLDGIYVVFLDADDTLKSHALEVMHENIVRHKCDLLIYGIDRVTNGAIVKPFDSKHSFTGTITDKRKLYNLVLKDWGYNPVCRKVANITLFAETDYSRFYDVRHGEDLLQSLTLYKNCKKAVFIKDALYNYVFNPQSVTRSVNHDNYEVVSTVSAEVLRFIEAENVQTQDDIQEYLAYCRRLLLGEIQTISAFKIPFREKAAFFNEILRDEYYLRLVNGAKPYEVALVCLKKGWFRMAALSSRIDFNLKRIGRVMNQIARKLK